MDLYRLAIVAAAATAAMAIDASAATTSPAETSTGTAAPACFNAQDIAQHWGVGGPNEVYFRVQDRSHHFTAATYEVTTAQACPAIEPPVSTNPASQNLEWPASYGLFVAAGRKNIACHASEVRLVGEKGPCTPVNMRRLSAAEAAALPTAVWKH